MLRAQKQPLKSKIHPKTTKSSQLTPSKRKIVTKKRPIQSNIITPHSTSSIQHITRTNNVTNNQTQITPLNKTPKRHFLGSLFGAGKDQRVVYEPLNSFNPITLRSTVVPVAYKFPSYILPSIDIISIASRQAVTPHYADSCYVIDKTPKLLQLPSISVVTQDSKFVQVFAEVTICVSNSLRFSLIGDNYVQVLQSLVETSVGNVISYISERDTLDKQYESFLVTNIHQDLQRLCDDVGVDVLKLVIMPRQLNLTNVAAQLHLLQTMNDLAVAISPGDDGADNDDNIGVQYRQAEGNYDDINGERVIPSVQQAQMVTDALNTMMDNHAQIHNQVNADTILKAKSDPIVGMEDVGKDEKKEKM